MARHDSTPPRPVAAPADPAPPPPTPGAAAPARLEIRKLARADGPALEAHLLRLEGEDRRMRFHGAVGDDAIRGYCARIDWAASLVLGGYSEGALVGVAELFLHRWPHLGEADLALSVERAHQRRGHGAALLATTLALARNRCVSRVMMTCLGANRPMQALARGFGAELCHLPGSVEGRIRAPWPDGLTLAEEATLESRAAFRAVFRMAGLGPPAPAPVAAPGAAPGRAARPPG